MTGLPLLAGELFDKPLLIEQRKLNAILSAVGPRMEVTLPPGADVRAWSGDEEDDPAPARAYVMDRGGVARLLISGTLVHRSHGMSGWSGLMSYQAITNALRAARADPAVKTILLEVDSGGGQVAGAFDLADEIFEGRDQKPIWAIAKDLAASAAYLLAAAASRVVVTQTGEVGSVGVIAAHTNYSKQNEMEGVAVTYIFAGDHKTDGWPDIPLAPAAKERFQADVDQTYALFVTKIAAFRKMSPLDVVATEALTYVGQPALAAGFADELATLDDTLAALAGAAEPARQPDFIELPDDGSDLSEGDDNMPGMDMTAIRQQAATEAADRVREILSAPEAKGRDDLARTLALDTNITPVEAKKILAKTPAAKPVDLLDLAMRGTNPQVGASLSEAGGGDDAAAIAAQMLADFRGPQPRH